MRGGTAEKPREMSPADALAIVADDPGTHNVTPRELRKKAAEWIAEGKRKRKAADLKAKRVGRRTALRTEIASLLEEAKRLRIYAEILHLAADEIERRKADTVGQAMGRRKRIVSTARAFLGVG